MVDQVKVIFIYENMHLFNSFLEQTECNGSHLYEFDLYGGSIRQMLLKYLVDKEMAKAMIFYF